MRDFIILVLILKFLKNKVPQKIKSLLPKKGAGLEFFVDGLRGDVEDPVDDVDVAVLGDDVVGGDGGVHPRPLHVDGGLPLGVIVLSGEVELAAWAQSWHWVFLRKKKGFTIFREKLKKKYKKKKTFFFFKFSIFFYFSGKIEKKKNKK